MNDRPADQEQKFGMFEVVPGLQGLRLQRAAYGEVKKFVEHYEKLGYDLVETPEYQLIPPWDVRYKSAGSTENLQLWVPEWSQGLHPDHPWYKPDVDQYQCWAWFSKKPETIKVWVPDEYIKEHGLPAGFIARE